MTTGFLLFRSGMCCALPFFDQDPDTRMVKSVTFSGMTILTPHFLEYLVKVKPKFKANELDIDIDRVRLLTSGFFEEVNCTIETVNQKLMVHFTVREKEPFPQYVINTCVVSGNQKTRASVILREFERIPGLNLDLAKLENGLDELEKLRIFKKVDVLLMPGPDRQVDVIIEIEEGLHHVGFIFPTYSSDNPDLWGFGPVGGYININLFGTASWLGLGGMWAKNRVLLAGTYLPRLLGTQQDLMLGFGYGEREQETFSRTFKKTGGEFKMSVGGVMAYWNIPLAHDLKFLQFGGLLENKFEPISGKVPSTDAWGPLYSATIAFDNRNDTLEPLSGWYPGLRLDVGSYIDEDGNRSNYYRYNPTLKRYFHVAGRHCLAVQVRGGVTNKDIPYLGKYQLGGSNDLRGFPEWSIVGNNYFLTNLEYRFPIYTYRSNYGISGVIFVDAGQAWDKGEKDFLNKIHVSEGVGLRFLLGPMILRLDYGRSEYSDGFYFYFGHLF